MKKKCIFYANAVLWDRVHARLLGGVYVWVWLLRLGAKIAVGSLAVVGAVWSTPLSGLAGVDPADCGFGVGGLPGARCLGVLWPWCRCCGVLASVGVAARPRSSGRSAVGRWQCWRRLARPGPSAFAWPWPGSSSLARLPSWASASCGVGSGGGLRNVSEMLREILREIMRDILRDMLREILCEILREIMRDILRDIFRDTLREILREIMREILREILRDVLCEIVREILREIFVTKMFDPTV